MSPVRLELTSCEAFAAQNDAAPSVARSQWRSLHLMASSTFEMRWVAAACLPQSDLDIEATMISLSAFSAGSPSSHIDRFSRTWVCRQAPVTLPSASSSRCEGARKCRLASRASQPQRATRPSCSIPFFAIFWAFRPLADFTLLLVYLSLMRLCVSYRVSQVPPPQSCTRLDAALPEPELRHGRAPRMRAARTRVRGSVASESA